MAQHAGRKGKEMAYEIYSDRKETFYLVTLEDRDSRVHWKNDPDAWIACQATKEHLAHNFARALRGYDLPDEKFGALPQRGRKTKPANREKVMNEIEKIQDDLERIKGALDHVGLA